MDYQMHRAFQSLTRIHLALVLILATVTHAQSSERGPVVVELYTSQGCSSCPPADDYFHRQLAQRDDIIALAFHVDYWDYIGWKDVFGDPTYTARQHSYARAAGHRSVYTPQMIVNGVDHVVGTHPDQINALVKKHKAVAAGVELTVARNGNRLKITATSSQEAAFQVHVIRYKDMEKVSIKRGENAGKILTYANIVSEWDMIKDWNGRSPLRMDVRIKGDAPAVVLIQHANGGPIETAARVR